MSAVSEGSAGADEDKSAVWGSGIGHMRSTRLGDQEVDKFVNVSRRRIHTPLN